MPGDIGFTREDPLHGAVRMSKHVVGPLSVDVRFDTISQFDCEMALFEQQRLLQENVTELSKLRSFDNLEPTLDSHAVLEIARLATERLRSFNRYLGWFDPATCRSRDVVRVMPSIGRKGVASWSVVESNSGSQERAVDLQALGQGSVGIGVSEDLEPEFEVAVRSDQDIDSVLGTA